MCNDDIVFTQGEDSDQQKQASQKMPLYQFDVVIFLVL